MAPEDGEEPEDYKGAGEDREANWYAADTNADGVLPVDVKGLGGPEEEDGEEVGARDKGDYKSEKEDTRVLFEA